MSTNPAYASTPNVGAAITSATLDTSLTAPTNVATVFTAGASGSKIDEIRINQVATTSGAGVLNLFLYDGSTYHLFDNYTWAAITLSTTSEAGVVAMFPENCLLKNGWSLRATVTTSAGQSAFKIIAIGGDF